MSKTSGNKNFKIGENKKKVIRADNEDDILTITVAENQKNGSESKKEVLPDAAINIESFNLSLGGKDLFVNAQLLITHGKRYGLVGSKGCGKTALLEYIANKKLGIPSNLDVVYWKKDIIKDNEVSVLKVVNAPSVKNAELLAEYDRLCYKVDLGQGNEEDKKRVKELWKELMFIDPEEVPAEAKGTRILSSLGILEDSKTIQEIPEHLRKRVSLARALYLEPSLLLLDEPTPELDLDAMIWLENYLQDWEKTLIIVSQDRCFLDNVCHEIIQIDQQKLFYYPGNYSYFELSAHRRRCSSKKEKAQKKKLQLKANMKSEEAAASTVEDQNGTKPRNLEMSNNIDEDRAPVQLLEKPRFWFLDPTEFKKRLLVDLFNVKFGYEKERPLFSDLSFGLERKYKAAVLGPSGVGKSTFLKILSGEIQPGKDDIQDEPVTVESEKQLRFGRFDQNIVYQLATEESPLEHLIKFVEKYGQKAVTETVGEKLSCLGLKKNLHTVQMTNLSPGERARVVLAQFCLIPHDALFLDEPTKHMDIEFIDALAHAICEYKGAIMIVTSNQYLLREPECELFYIQDKRVLNIRDFDKYREMVLTDLNEPIRGPFTYNRIIPEKSIKLRSDSEIINKYLEDNPGEDPSIREIGEYAILFEESTDGWSGFSVTLGSGSYAKGKTKEICRKKVLESIETHLEWVIENNEEVLPPP